MTARPSAAAASSGLVRRAATMVGTWRQSHIWCVSGLSAICQWYASGRYPWSTSGLSAPEPAYAHQGGEGVRHSPVHRVLEHDPGELRGVVRGEDLTCVRVAPSLSTAISRATHRDSLFTPNAGPSSSDLTDVGAPRVTDHRGPCQPELHL
jgi:hypothetical protein